MHLWQTVNQIKRLPLRPSVYLSMRKREQRHSRSSGSLSHAWLRWNGKTSLSAQASEGGRRQIREVTPADGHLWDTKWSITSLWGMRTRRLRFGSCSSRRRQETPCSGRWRRSTTLALVSHLPCLPDSMPPYTEPIAQPVWDICSVGYLQFIQHLLMFSILWDRNACGREKFYDWVLIVALFPAVPYKILG